MAPNTSSSKPADSQSCEGEEAVLAAATKRVKGIYAEMKPAKLRKLEHDKVIGQLDVLDKAIASLVQTLAPFPVCVELLKPFLKENRSNAAQEPTAASDDSAAVSTDSAVSDDQETGETAMIGNSDYVDVGLTGD